jgi:hypothetical protein
MFDVGYSRQIGVCTTLVHVGSRRILGIFVSRKKVAFELNGVLDLLAAVRTILRMSVVDYLTQTSPRGLRFLVL